MVPKYNQITFLFVPLAIAVLFLTGCNAMSINAQNLAYSDPDSNWKRLNTETSISATYEMKSEKEIEPENTTHFDHRFIERAQKGKLFNSSNKLGDNRDQLLSTQGEPVATGSYEGGDYYEYNDYTFFVNPDTHKIVSIAKPVDDLNYTMKEVKENMGAPSFEGFDEMDGFWTMEYEVDRNAIRFESNEQDGNLAFVWLVERDVIK